jgi:hypothetical protein
MNMKIFISLLFTCIIQLSFSQVDDASERRILLNSNSQTDKDIENVRFKRIENNENSKLQMQAIDESNPNNRIKTTFLQLDSTLQYQEIVQDSFSIINKRISSNSVDRTKSIEPMKSIRIKE